MGILDKIKGNMKNVGAIVGFLSPPNAIDEMTGAVMKIARGGGHIPRSLAMQRLLKPETDEGASIKAAAVVAIGALAAREFKVPVVKDWANPIVEGSIGFMIGRTVNHALYWATHT